MVFSWRGTNLDIELLELLQVEAAGGAVLQEALVPLLQLMLVKLCVFHQVLHHFGGQFAVLLPHFACKHEQTQQNGMNHVNAEPANKAGYDRSGLGAVWRSAITPLVLLRIKFKTNATLETRISLLSPASAGSVLSPSLLWSSCAAVI